MCSVASNDNAESDDADDAEEFDVDDTSIFCCLLGGDASLPSEFSFFWERHCLTRSATKNLVLCLIIISTVMSQSSVKSLEHMGVESMA